MIVYETERLIFKPSLNDVHVWWALGEDSVEYCIRPAITDQEQWEAFMQKRISYNSVSESIGVFEDFEDACLACDEAESINF